MEQLKCLNIYVSRKAERVVVLMGSAAKTAEETVDFLRHQGEKAGGWNFWMAEELMRW